MFSLLLDNEVLAPGIQQLLPACLRLHKLLEVHLWGFQRQKYPWMRGASLIHRRRIFYEDDWLGFSTKMIGRVVEAIILEWLNKEDSIKSLNQVSVWHVWQSTRHEIWHFHGGRAHLYGSPLLAPSVLMSALHGPLLRVQVHSDSLAHWSQLIVNNLKTSQLDTNLEWIHWWSCTLKNSILKWTPTIGRLGSVVLNPPFVSCKHPIKYKSGTVPIKLLVVSCTPPTACGEPTSSVCTSSLMWSDKV